MTILDRYIARLVVNGTLMVLLVLAALLGFVDFVSEMGSTVFSKPSPLSC